MSNSFIGEVRAFTYNFAPEGWLDCLGQVLNIQQYQLLFAVIGGRYGGDGRTTFGLPDLRGRGVIGQGQGVGLSNQPLGQLQGSDTVALTSVQQLPAHSHTITSKFMSPAAAPGASGSTPNTAAYVARLLNLTLSPTVTYPAYSPASPAPVTQMASNALSTFPSAVAPVQAHENRQPFTTVRYCICVTDGTYPPRQ